MLKKIKINKIFISILYLIFSWLLLGMYGLEYLLIILSLLFFIPLKKEINIVIIYLTFISFMGIFAFFISNEKLDEKYDNVILENIIKEKNDESFEYLEIKEKKAHYNIFYKIENVNCDNYVLFSDHKISLSENYNRLNKSFPKQTKCLNYIIFSYYDKNNNILNIDREFILPYKKNKYINQEGSILNSIQFEKKFGMNFEDFIYSNSNSVFYIGDRNPLATRYLLYSSFNKNNKIERNEKNIFKVIKNQDVYKIIKEEK